jgi:4a-hydroxytetrahydrobiopterin dehydratase
MPDGECYPVAGGFRMAEPQVYTEEQVREGLAKLDGWELRDARLRKQYTFRTFLRAIAFVNSVAYLAESAGHHPDITINYNKVTLRLTTHSAGALTDRDFSLASDIDARLASKLMIAPEEPATGPP